MAAKKARRAASAKSSGRPKNEDQDVLNYLKQAGKEAQRNVTMTQKLIRSGPAPEVGSWNQREVEEINKYYRVERRAQSQAAKLAQGQRDIMSGRTVDAGTRSMLEGLKSWMRGGGLTNRGK